MRRSRLVLAAVLAIAAAGTVAAPAAHASWRAPCAEGAKRPLCTFWPARATFIADGDTIRATVAGRPVDVRFTGINAMELHRYSKYAARRRGECHGLAATALVERYIRRSHWRIRLAAQHASSRTGHRIRRAVWVKVRGRWRDLSRLEMEAGLALWLPNGREWAHNLEYHRLAEHAALAHRALYDPSSCGAGPDQDLPVSLVVNWDADGGDRANLDGEWVEVRNGGVRPLPLGGWWLRDSWLNYDAHHNPGYTFPASAVVPAGGALRLHMGCGRDGARDLYWCQHSSVFENVTTDRAHMGDGGYLFDPQGDLRAASMYPCVVACTDPLRGAIRLSVHPTTPESISITNVGGAPVDLADHVLKLRSLGRRDAFIFGYAFGPGSVLGPGATMRVLPSGSPASASALVRHLGRGTYALADGGGALSLRTMTDVVTACAAWGRGRGRC